MQAINVSMTAASLDAWPIMTAPVNKTVMVTPVAAGNPLCALGISIVLMRVSANQVSVSLDVN